MAKIIIETPESLHKLIKFIAGAKGESLKSFIIRAIENTVEQETQINVKSNDGNYITEEQALKLLKPVILKYVSGINK